MHRAGLFVVALLWSADVCGQSVYFGNLHSHTSYSDGSGTPDEAYAQARATGLDFFAITEHNHSAGDGKGVRHDGLMIATQPLLYSGHPSSLIEAAKRANTPGSFVAIYGQEFSTISQGNHINVFDVGSVIDDRVVTNGRVDKLLNWMGANHDSSGQVPLLQFNHPRDPDRNLKDYGRDDFSDLDWVKTLDPFVELIEVLNAPALKDVTGARAEAKEGYYLDYLNLGFHLGPSVGQDNHFRNWGTSTDARIGVIATALTREAIIAGLRSRHTFASDDKNLKVIFRSDQSLSGDIVPLPADGSALPLTVEISDADEPDAKYRIDVLTDHPGGDRARRPINSFIVNGNTSGRFVLDGIAYDGPGQFVLLKIVQSSAERGDEEHEEQEDRLWTAPIWYEASAATPIVSETIRIAALLPNPAGNELDNESVTLLNSGAAPVDMSGWQLRDASGNTWILSGIIAAGKKLVVLRSRQAMSLNNDGDVVELVNRSGMVVHKTQYGSAAEDAVVNVPQP